MNKSILDVLNFQPCTLYEEELENPEEVIANFYQNYPIQRSRALLWDWYRDWIVSSSRHPEIERAAELFNFYANMVGFLEAVYVCDAKRSARKAKAAIALAKSKEKNATQFSEKKLHLEEKV